jgi:hypothetical protein
LHEIPRFNMRVGVGALRHEFLDVGVFGGGQALNLDMNDVCIGMDFLFSTIHSSRVRTVGVLIDGKKMGRLINTSF